MKGMFVRFACMALALLMLLSGLVSCTRREEDESTDDGTQQTVPPAIESPETITRFTVEILSTMKIVYAHGASEEIAAKADELKNVIKSIYGVELVVASDYLRAGSSIYCEIPNEILIGETNRTADDAYYDAIRYEDYGYTTSGGKIIIGGGNAQATLKAVSDFAYNIITLKKGGTDLLFCPEFSMEFNYDYTAKEILLNDVPCQEYRVVYPANGTQFEEQLAIHVVSNLEQLIGYRLDIVSDDTAYTDGYEILIGKTNRSDGLYATATEEFEGCIAANGKFIALYGDSALGNAVATTELIDRIQASVADKKADLKLSDSEVIREKETIAEMTYNIYAGDVSVDRSNQVFELMLRYLPDVIGIQEGSPDWMIKFDNTFSEYYDRVGTGAFGGTVGSFNSILYSKERFELLETQTKWLSDTPDEISRVEGAIWIRIFTYALLKDRVTGETICFVNTHLDFGAAKLPQVKILFQLLLEFGLEDYPVVLTGDMNSSIVSNELKYMMAMGLSSANSVADVTDGVPDIDFIMVSGDCIDVSYARVCNETIQGKVPSDHPATYAEFTVTLPDGGIDHDFREPLPTFPNGWLDVERDESAQYGELNRAPGTDKDGQDEEPDAGDGEDPGDGTEDPDDGMEDPENPPGQNEGLQVETEVPNSDFGQLNRAP